MNTNKKRTDDIYTYLKFRGDLEFKNAPLNEVDALILSELAYIHFEKHTAHRFSRLSTFVNTFPFRRACCTTVHVKTGFHISMCRKVRFLCGRLFRYLTAPML